MGMTRWRHLVVYSTVETSSGYDKVETPSGYECRIRNRESPGSN